MRVLLITTLLPLLVLVHAASRRDVDQPRVTLNQPDLRSRSLLKVKSNSLRWLERRVRGYLATLEKSDLRSMDKVKGHRVLLAVRKLTDAFSTVHAQGQRSIEKVKAELSRFDRDIKNALSDSRTTDLRLRTGHPKTESTSTRVTEVPTHGQGQQCGLRPLLPNNGAYELEGSPLRTGPQERIVGGDESTPFSWPSICGLTYKTGLQFCGGTLVKNSQGQFVFITAAHCLDSLNAGRYRVYCGQHDTRGDSPSHRQILRLSSIKRHEQYNENTNDNDIAVMKFLTQPVENNYVQAACLAEDDNFEGEQSIVVGWGTVASDGPTPDKLRQVNKPIKSDAVCIQRLGHEYHSDNMMCAGYTTGGADACQGDSGGPMYTLRNNAWTLTGVVSWGYGCADAYSPGVYADVYQLRAWIDKNIN